MRFSQQLSWTGLILITMILSLLVVIGLISFLLAMVPSPSSSIQLQSSLTLLTDPFLQRPTQDSVQVVWFTEFPGRSHTLHFGQKFDQTATATTSQLSRLVNGQVTPRIQRSIWRHEATATNLQPGIRVPYYVISETESGESIQSQAFTLQPLPQPGQPLKILLTSDHQLMPNTHLNLQKVAETIGQVDAVFMAGDLVNIPDRAEEWFEHTSRGIGFFPALQGRAQIVNPTTAYRGGEILQHAHLFPAIGNHEVMGHVDPDTGLAHYPGARPRWYAEIAYENVAGTVNPKHDPAIRSAWIQDHSWNTVTYEEIFSLPDQSPGGERYYSQAYGDIFLISLFITRPWRVPSLDPTQQGKYQEAQDSLTDPDHWGFGDFLFEPYEPGSAQYSWLEAQLSSPAFQQSKYRYVMAHQVSRGIGDNAIPLMSDPVGFFAIQTDPEHFRIQQHSFPIFPEVWQSSIEPILSSLTSVRYDYPRSRDFWHLTIEPLLATAGVNLIHHGHSHLWYRIQTPAGLRFLESSNVGNTYGAFLKGYKNRSNLPKPKPAQDPHQDPQQDPKRSPQDLAQDSLPYDLSNYAEFGDPYGADPDPPSQFAPMRHQGRPLPTIDSNDLSVFTILDTSTGKVSSYVIDVNDPEAPAQLFDEFDL